MTRCSRRRATIRSMLLATLALLCACTAATFLYNRADAILAHYFEGLVSLQGDQRAQLRGWLKSNLQWHRDSQIDRYVKFLATVDHDLAAPLPVSAYDSARLELEGFVQDIAEHAAPDAIAMLRGLSKTQLDELYQSLEDDEKKRAEKLAKKSTQELKEDREKTTLKTLTRWTGSASDRQRAIVHASIERIEFIDTLQEQARAQWRQSLKSGVEQVKATGNQQPLREVLLHPEQFYPAEYRAREKRNTQEVLQMIASLDQSLSAEQRANLRQQVRELSRDIAALANS
jgi:hypothetical protein